MDFLYTNGKNQDFIELCFLLDEGLNKLAGGEENRKEYVEHNKLDDIHDVVVGYDEGIAVACASFKHIDNNTVEIKRVFVREEYRGKGIAKSIMNEIENKAKEKGYSELVLETGRKMIVAVSLYKSLGYKEIPNYGQYKNMVKSVCMKKYL